MALLFLDLLGVKSHWSSGGRAAAQARFSQFEALISATLSIPGITAPTLGTVESDAAAFDFASDESAIRFGAALYQAAFDRPRRPADSRMWLRGTLLTAAAGSSLRTTGPLAASIAYVQKSSYSDSLLDAIAIEKSGIKGMRLVISDTMLSAATKAAFVQVIGVRNFYPFRRLNHTGYPTQIATGFSDVLWMTVGRVTAWETSRSQMSKMLRWAAADSEEFQQAAATQLAFNEVDAIVQSL